MARRKRLTPPRTDYLEPSDPGTLAPGPLSAPPIAQVAGDAATGAALEALSEEMTRARAEGRFIEALPLDAVDAGYLVRDRIGVSDEDQSALIDSLRARGQQTAIEVVDLGPDRAGGRYGLISGWRRLMALRHLHDDTKDSRFSLVQARITRPGETSEAYLAMVEENEIRVGLSHYERARIAVRAVEEGVFPHDRAALDALYSNVSRAKKSKIRSFIALVRRLDDVLRFPALIGERLGLDLARRLGEDREFAKRVSDALKRASPKDAEAEQVILKQSLNPGLETNPKQESKVQSPSPARPRPGENAPPHLRASFEKIHAEMTGEDNLAEQPPARVATDEDPDGVTMQHSPGRQEIRLSGPGVDRAFAQALAAWLESRPHS